MSNPGRAVSRFSANVFLDQCPKFGPLNRSNRAAKAIRSDRVRPSALSAGQRTQARSWASQAGRSGNRSPSAGGEAHSAAYAARVRAQRSAAGLSVARIPLGECRHRFVDDASIQHGSGWGKSLKGRADRFRKRAEPRSGPLLILALSLLETPAASDETLGQIDDAESDEQGTKALP